MGCSAGERDNSKRVRQMGFPSLSLAAFVLMVAGLSAQTTNQTGQSQSAGECDNTADMRSREASRYGIAQREFNAAYQNLMGHLDSGQKEKLRLAQRAWIRSRDANVNLPASPVQGGTVAPLVRISVLTDMTKARTLELDQKTPPSYPKTKYDLGLSPLCSRFSRKPIRQCHLSWQGRTGTRVR